MRSVRTMEREAAAGHIKPPLAESDTVKSGWIETYSGTKLYFNDPDLDAINVKDVALVLSRICRYNGHTKRFYSVGEHACHLADWVEEQPWATARDKLTALHHDDAEYVIGDMARPVKVTIPQFKAVEEVLDQALAQKFWTIWPMPKWLKEIDGRILQDERAQIMNPSNNDWGLDHLEPLGIRLWVMGRFAWYVRWQWMRRHRKYNRQLRAESGLG